MLSITEAVPPDSEITDDQPPAKKQRLSSKEVEDIMGNELSNLHINMTQNLLKAQFPWLKD